jgi:hypothetical protein
MGIFWKREKEVKRLLFEYFAAVEASMGEFERAMKCFLEHGHCPEFREHDKLTHKHESRADDLRWEIEVLLYKRALLPESRDDILQLLESYDHLPNLAENITFVFDTQRVTVPPELRERFLALVEANLQAYRHMHHAVELLFSKPEAIETEIRPVDQYESASDGLERELIIDLFRSEVPRAECLQLRDVIQRIGDLSDTAEKLVRRLEILSLKKRI